MDKLRAERKSTFAPGPWHGEPDRVEWRAHGFPCIVLRQARRGHLCGYVGVAPGHPWHGKAWDCIGASVHGGITYTEPCIHETGVCHVPEPGEAEELWWVGFDAAHAWDLSPSSVGQGYPFDPGPRDVYRDVAYMRAETEALARQAAEAVG